MNISAKQKMYFSIISISILLIISYSFAIKKTIHVIKNNSVLQQNIDSAQTAPQQLLELQQQVNEFNKVIGGEIVSETQFQQDLIEKISAFSKTKNLEIRNFPAPHYFNKENLKLITYRFTVTGAYVDMIQLIHMLEQQQNAAKIVSVQFEKNIDMASKQTYLLMTIFIQKITKNNEKI